MVTTKSLENLEQLTGVWARCAAERSVWQVPEQYRENVEDFLAFRKKGV